MKIIAPQKNNTSKLLHSLYTASIALFFFIPFHTFLTTWAGSLFGYRPVWQAWKEVLLLCMCAVAVFLVYNDGSLRKHIIKWRVNQLIAVYAFLHVVLGFLFHINIATVIFGMKYNLEFLIFFVLTQIVVYYSKEKDVVEKFSKIVLTTAMGVVAFGLLQVFVLPKDFLVFFGYGDHSVIPYMPLNIDENSERVRILSTIGGPIQLGVFLLLPYALALMKALKEKNFFWWFVVLAFIVVEFFSYSRGPWGGMLLVTMIIFVSKMKKVLNRKKFFWTLFFFFAIVVFAGIFVVKNIESSKFLQETVLHSSTYRLWSDSSNSIRLGIIKDSIRSVLQNPFGIGPGTVGPASHFLGATKVLQENYYLQIALEVGIFGMLLFLGISFLILKDLWHKRYELPHAFPLFASMLGIMLVNMVTHWGWADSSTALVWWGLAGSSIRK